MSHQDARGFRYPLWRLAFLFVGLVLPVAVALALNAGWPLPVTIVVTALPVLALVALFVAFFRTTRRQRAVTDSPAAATGPGAVAGQTSPAPAQRLDPRRQLVAAAACAVAAVVFGFRVGGSAAVIFAVLALAFVGFAVWIGRINRRT
ncbi:MAG: hypothetical protein ACXV3V_10230 [Actinomycetes bacterium]